MDGTGCGVRRLLLSDGDGDGRRNEGTGLAGRVEGSFERQDWKEGMTLDIRSLKRFAMTRLERNGAVSSVCLKSMEKLFVQQSWGFI